MKYNRNVDKPKLCRVTSLKGFQGVIIGRDMADLFEEGHVYQVNKIMGEIILKDLGEHACERWLMDEKGSLTARVGSYVTSGVAMLTKKEYKLQQQFEKE